MKDESRQAFPVAGMSSFGFSVVNELGLTKRELFAAMAMQGIIANPGTNGFDIYAAVAKSAVEQADALLAALEVKDG